MPTNIDWHAEHLLTSNASAEERITWHTDHAQVCDCRPIPADLYDLLTNNSEE